MEKRTLAPISMVVLVGLIIAYLLTPKKFESKDPDGTFKLFFLQVTACDRKKMEAYMYGEFVQRMKPMDTITLASKMPNSITSVSVERRDERNAVLLVKGLNPVLGPVEGRVKLLLENKKWRIYDIDFLYDTAVNEKIGNLNW
ncbi:MAG TPA: hypothetical protein VGB38_01445 [bacterium]